MSLDAIPREGAGLRGARHKPRVALLPSPAGLIVRGAIPRDGAQAEAQAEAWAIACNPKRGQSACSAAFCAPGIIRTVLAYAR